MNKQQQIEEFQNDIIDNLFDGGTYKLAEALYNAGYRKVPDGAVVLLIGKNNQALDEKTIEYFVKHNEQIRKETAKEILNAVDNESNGQTISEELITDIKREAVKEFAEKLKRKCHNYYPSIDHYCCSEKAVNVKDIDDLLKEYEK